MHYVFQSLRDVTGAEFKLFMDFLSSLSIFGESAPPDRIQELIEIIEGQADLDVQFNVSNHSFLIHVTFLKICSYARKRASIIFFVKLLCR